MLCLQQAWFHSLYSGLSVAGISTLNTGSFTSEHRKGWHHIPCLKLAWPCSLIWRILCEQMDVDCSVLKDLPLFLCDGSSESLSWWWRRNGESLCGGGQLLWRVAVWDIDMCCLLATEIFRVVGYCEVSWQIQSLLGHHSVSSPVCRSYCRK